MSGTPFFVSTIGAVIRSGLIQVLSHGQVWPFHSDKLQPHVVTVCNRVLLRRGDHSKVSYAKLSFFVASSLECNMLVGPMVHRPDDDVLKGLCPSCQRSREVLSQPTVERCCHCWPPVFRGRMHQKMEDRCVEDSYERSSWPVWSCLQWGSVGHLWR